MSRMSTRRRTCSGGRIPSFSSESGDDKPSASRAFQLWRRVFPRFPIEEREAEFVLSKNAGRLSGQLWIASVATVVVTVWSGVSREYQILTINVPERRAVTIARTCSIFGSLMLQWVIYGLLRWISAVEQPRSSAANNSRAMSRRRAVWARNMDLVYFVVGLQVKRFVHEKRKACLIVRHLVCAGRRDVFAHRRSLAQDRLSGHDLP